MREALDEISDAEREHDRWERKALAQAISPVFGGIYLLAVTGAELATTPPEKRSPSARLGLAVGLSNTAAMGGPLGA